MSKTDSHFKYSQRAQEATAVNITFIVLTTVAVSLRIWVRKHMLGVKLGLDDIFIILGAFFSIVECVACLISVRYGLGQNVEDVGTDDMVSYIKANLGASICYQPAVTFTRLSILAFYYRHLRPPSRSFLRISILCLSSFIAAMLVWGLLVVILQCLPISYQWEQVSSSAADKKGKCLQLLPFYYVHASFGLVCDLLVYALPIRTLWGLNLPKRQRIGLVFVFGLGAFVCIASAVRIHSLKKLLNSKNPTVALVDAINWSSVEINLGIVCASIPTYKPLLKKYFPSGSEIASSVRGMLSSATAGLSTTTTTTTTGVGGGSKMGTNISRTQEEERDGEEMVEWRRVVKEPTGKSRVGPQE